MTQSRFAGSVALVTGAASGIGRAVATRLAGEGASVVVFDLNGDGGAATVDEIETAGGRAVLAVGDVTSESDRRGALDAATSLGGLDVLVNNAADLSEKSLLDADSGYWERVLAVNLIAPALFIREAASMLSSHDGAVVNISSVRALASVPGAAAYEASKAGLLALTRSAAIELAATGVRVNAVCPGFTPGTPAWVDEVPPTAREAWYATHGGAPIGRPEDIAAAVAFLASADAKFVNGAALVVDGATGAQHPFAAALRAIEAGST